MIAVAALLVLPSLRALDIRFARRGLWFALAWIVFVPVFFLVPQQWDGGYERGLAGMLLGWMISVALFVKRHP